ncbi:hypothetical protein [Pelagicoccus sp. SDUM812005]|uniref:hypothetical protein n=1 Tax=Pelagicoccus sp. SDUM812005 TaxID=3041257 RepID=UPI00280CF819|nr:hypothetical protein [Pelagicoccus sp. SDUM812005]MDQ8181547.1 hypothetical protein [Pelagicoccus sp. SDUM812005]
MKNKSTFMVLVFSFLLASANAAPGESPRGDIPPDELFARLDVDRSALVDESELALALKFHEQRRMERIAEWAEVDARRAEFLQARMISEQADSMLGTPDRAAAFIMANFDRDGDWELDREEVGQAFSSLRKWRSEGRS